MSFAILDTNGMPHGPFESPVDAAQWAAHRWPDQEQAENIEDLSGWRHVAMQPVTTAERQEP